MASVQSPRRLKLVKMALVAVFGIGSAGRAAAAVVDHMELDTGAVQTVAAHTAVRTAAVHIVAVHTVAVG